jgi:predicted HicB family RNase H-like nuclease
MSELIIRMPPDKHERLKQVAKSRNVSVNKKCRASRGIF